MNKNHTAQLALQRLQERTGIAGQWKVLKREIDGKVDFHFKGKDKIFYALVKSDLRLHQLPPLMELARLHKPFIVIAGNIYPAVKEILREKRISYLDTAGNIYVQTPDNYIWIDGQKAAIEKKAVANRAFTKTGLKTVFYLLLNKQAVNFPYRKLAEVTGVALGNITNVIEGLKDAGFILQLNGKEMKLQNEKALLDRWITGYGETLKPTLYLETYKFWDPEKLRNWETLPMGKDETCWGGEPAAAHLTRYLTPATFTVYTKEKNPIVTKWKLIPDKEGSVFFYKKFWKDIQKEDERFAPPLLVYADLLLTDDPRCVETAQMIYDNYLKHEFE